MKFKPCGHAEELICGCGTMPPPTDITLGPSQLIADMLAADRIRHWESKARDLIAAVERYEDNHPSGAPCLRELSMAGQDVHLTANDPPMPYVGRHRADAS